MIYQHQELTHQIIGAAIEVHKTLGPGLLESAYRHCLAFETDKRIGLLINFNVVVLKDGIHRSVLNAREFDVQSHLTSLL